ncbi:MAG TPA: tetratricopeptide repeat protein, partial [Verrucomicrobiae bacterium]|nr:tetratricopeptide repeat protein [Verrucomicrobiae bacterium]
MQKQNKTVWILVLIVLIVSGAIYVFRPARESDRFTHLTAVGKGYLEKGDATNAITAYSEVVKLAPESVDARLNLANAYLLANDNPKAIEQCRQALALDHNSAAAYYLMGCAYLRQNQAEPAVQAFQQSQKIDPAVTALNFQLGLAQERLGHLDDAVHEFETVVQFEPEHPSAHYRLSQLYQRAGRTADAARELQAHQQILAKNPNPPSDPALFEKCKYTQPIIAFTLDQPEQRGIPVRFVEATATAFDRPSAYHGPIGVLDYNHDGRNSLFVMEGNGFRLLNNQNGRFAPLGDILPGKPGAVYRRCLVGDLNNDRFEDVIVLGEQDSHAFKFATNGQFRDFTVASGLKNLVGRDGLLADVDFIGRLDLLAVQPDGQGVRVFHNLGNFYFRDDTTASGLPASLPGVEHLATEDWNNEDAAGLFVTRNG